MNRALLSLTLVSMLSASFCLSCQEVPIDLDDICPEVALISLADYLGQQIASTDVQSLLPEVPYELSEDILNCLPISRIDSRFFSFFRFTPRY